MRPPHVAVRRLLVVVGMALAVALPPIGCSESKTDGSAAPVNQEANKKSMQATGDFYQQQHKKK
jgi:hypothetical protein